MNILNQKNLQHFTNNLNIVDPLESIFKKKHIIYNVFNIINKDYKKWIKKELLPNTRLIIEPKIKGYSIALNFDKGLFKQAISKNGTDITQLVRRIKNVPLRIAINKEIHILGLLYYPQKSPAKKLSFCSFELINSNLNQYSKVDNMNKLGFEVPKMEFTRFHLSEIDIYLDLVKQRNLFYEYPLEGVVLKVNSRKFQKQLRKINNYNNWMCSVLYD